MECTQRLLVVLLIIASLSQFQFTKAEYDGYAPMKVVQAYDDIRILESRQIQQDPRNEKYLESLFSNYTQEKGLEKMVKSMTKLLANKGNSQTSLSNLN
jgi:hypothetical protein